MRTAEDLKKIRTALDERNKSDNPQLDAAFHMNVAYAAHNPLLADFYNEICRYMIKNLPEKPLEGKAYLEETALHEQLFQALADQDAQLAQTTAQAIVNIYASRF